MYWETQEYVDGYRAFSEGIKKNSNPYKLGTQQRGFWNLGWEQAAFENDSDKS
jgi:ribosome modulation factor